MIVLPIVGRELRVASRRVATYRTRLWAALAAAALSVWKAWDFAWQGASSSVQGQSLFYTLAGLAFIYCLFIGARVTADCVSEEKREGTLGLLFLTDLKGFDVVLGKLVASSLNSFYGLLAVFPLLAVPLLLGGVALAQFGKMVLVLLDTLFFSLSVGIFVSSLSRNDRKSMLATMLGVVLPAAIPFCVIFFMVMVLEMFPNPTTEDVERMITFLVANPIYPFVMLLPIPRPLLLTIPASSFWVSLGIVFGMGLLLLVMTAIILPRIWKDRARVARSPNSLSLVERWRLLAFGNSTQRKALRDRLLGRNPFLWLVSRDRLKPAYAWFYILSMVVIWAWGYWEHREVMFDFYPLIPTVILIHTVLKVWVITEVSHRLVEDQRHGALELLLATPLTTEEMFVGQRMALLRQFGWPVLALCSIELLTFRHAYPIPVILPVLIILVADLYTLLMVSMRLSLTSRSINEVVLKSVLWVMLAPWIVYLVAWPVVSWIWHNFIYGVPVFRHRLYFWFAISILTDLFLVGAWARPGLVADLPALLRRWRAAAQLAQKWCSGRLKSQA